MLRTGVDLGVTCGWSWGTTMGWGKGLVPSSDQERWLTSAPMLTESLTGWLASGQPLDWETSMMWRSAVVITYCTSE